MFENKFKMRFLDIPESSSDSCFLHLAGKGFTFSGQRIVMSGSASQGPNMPYPAVLTDVSHGSHVCAFYETADDLLDLVLPFFKVGLDQGESCVWMMPDGIIEDEAKIRASEALVERGLEFYPARDLYLTRGLFDRGPVMRFWDQKAQQALASNRSGARISGNAFWLKQNDWNTFLEYESDLNSMMPTNPRHCFARIHLR
jgi:hypothetical protein